jgi:hypothetical protein
MGLTLASILRGDVPGGEQSVVAEMLTRLSHLSGRGIVTLVDSAANVLGPLTLFDVRDYVSVRMEGDRR